ncbi:MAG: DNA polymerase III subunit delta' [Alphaproteobacteria bacterium]|nr:DNA polymerase III subunit delta' [Alphaproteobacteria bacterium]
MNIPDPQRTPFLIGHESATRQIADTFASGRMPQAWLIYGIDGIGKATFAYHAANFVFSDGKNPIGNLDFDNSAAKLVAAEAHPDLFVLRRPVDEKTGEQKDSIPVDDARKIAPFMHRTATHGKWRIAIIDEAHFLNRHGQNAILKIIEEPPENCLILITASTPGALVATIRSRCRLLPLEPLSKAAMMDVMSRLGADTEVGEDDLSRIIELSGGSVGFALKLLSAECLPVYDEMLALLDKMPEMDVPGLHALADKISRKADADSFKAITKLLIDRLRENVHTAATGPADRGHLDRCLRLWEKVKQSFIMADRSNLDRKLAFINAMTEIRRGI